MSCAPDDYRESIPLAHEFVRSIVERRPPALDIMTAANWTAAGVCAHESAIRMFRCSAIFLRRSRKCRDIRFLIQQEEMTDEPGSAFTHSPVC